MNIALFGSDIAPRYCENIAYLLKDLLSAGVGLSYYKGIFPFLQEVAAASSFSLPEGAVFPLMRIFPGRQIFSWRWGETGHSSTH
mgnify:CR=1 FL=1